MIIDQCMLSEITIMAINKMMAIKVILFLLTGSSNFIPFFNLMENIGSSLMSRNERITLTIGMNNAHVTHSAGILDGEQVI